jgi:hypothetical protein
MHLQKSVYHSIDVHIKQRGIETNQASPPASHSPTHLKLYPQKSHETWKKDKHDHDVILYST